jgi:hypothetical protein
MSASTVRLAGRRDSSPWSAVQRLAEDRSCGTRHEVESGRDQDPGYDGNHYEGVAEQRQMPVVAAAAAAEPMVLALLRGGRDGVLDAGVGEVALVACAVGEAVAS